MVDYADGIVDETVEGLLNYKMKSQVSCMDTCSG